MKTRAMQLIPPGQDGGPCVGPCHHAGCQVQRKWADTLCSECHQPIGYGVKFYRDTDGSYIHAACHELKRQPAHVKWLAVEQLR